MILEAEKSVENTINNLRPDNDDDESDSNKPEENHNENESTEEIIQENN
jgi:hypothetical protein